MKAVSKPEARLTTAELLSSGPLKEKKRDRPKITWRRTTDVERQNLDWKSWNQIEQEAKEGDAPMLLRSPMLHPLEQRGVSE